jgi:rubrerythrin
MISRRQLLYYSALFSLFYPIANIKYIAGAAEKINEQHYPLTIDILKEAYWAEVIASKHYVGYCEKALEEKYLNIAYLFSAFSVSENIHAENYKKVIISLGSTLKEKVILVSVADTKKNLNLAATKEIKKITEFYPGILKKLSMESHEQAIEYSNYSWKSHQQHEEIINDIKRFSGIFFRPLAKKIERMNPNYYVCEICGSTRDEKPEKPCYICNYPVSYYKNIKRPELFKNCN